MSEKLLKVILELLAIVAKEDDVTSDEIISVKKFLEAHVNRADTKRYLAFFDSCVEKIGTGEDASKASRVLAISSGARRSW